MFAAVDSIMGLPYMFYAYSGKTPLFFVPMRQSLDNRQHVCNSLGA